MSSRSKSKNVNQSGVNSEDYWDLRFRDDWDEKSGDKQSKFFMNIAFEMIPEWLDEYLKKGGVSFLDWGCAEGDGTVLLAKKYKKTKFTGIDFAKSAIERADLRYGKEANLQYRAIDILTEKYSEKYNVVFCSNVLEHFHDPWSIFEKVSTFAEDVFVMMVPFNEDPSNLHFEHFHSFSSKEFTLVSPDWTIAHFSLKNTAALKESYWLGQQALVIFVRNTSDLLKNIKFSNTNLSSEYNLQLEDEIRLKDNLLDDNNRCINGLVDKVISLENQMHAIEYDRSFSSSNTKLLHNGITAKIANRLAIRDIKNGVKLLKKSVLFDVEFYRNTYPDIDLHGVDPYLHYINHGAKEGRWPSTQFDTELYNALYPDVLSHGINPLIHFIKNGREEGRVCGISTSEYSSKKIPLAFQLDSFDKGGLEEVVLMLASNKEINELFQVNIFVVNGQRGYLSEIAESRGLKVYYLNQNPHYLKVLVKRLNVKICNLHYSTFGLNIYRTYGTKLIYTVHNNYIWGSAEFNKEKKTEYQKIDSFIAVSSQVSGYFSQKFGVSNQKIEVVSNGIDISDNELIIRQSREDYNLVKEDIVFINVASFTPNKYHASLIRAFAEVVNRCRNAKLILVGNIISQSYYESIIRLIDNYELKSNIIIINYLPKHKLFGLMQQCDCFVMPSLTEGFSIATLEAAFHSLPLILTDVGGARDLIKDGDCGVIISNSYHDLQHLNEEVINSLYVGDENASNYQELASAMTDVIDHPNRWKKKGKNGAEKVRRSFTSDVTVGKYLEEFLKLLSNDSLAKVIGDIESYKPEVAFFAPFPTEARVTEGWMSRINAVDKIIGGRKKIYINIAEDNQPATLNTYKTGIELSVGVKSSDYYLALDRIYELIKFSYVHTLHLAEYALPWLGEGKTVVDFHGITPEEEVMMKRSYLKERYEDIEKIVLKNARYCVMVTDAMRLHYEQKYPEITLEKIIILPIVEEIELVHKKIVTSEDLKVVYSGGTQEWQNVPEMIDFAKRHEGRVSMTFLSHDWSSIKELGESRKLKNATYEFCKKDNLKKKYSEFEFGLVLRDDTPVNRVACPTKLYEYMASGIVPVVKFAELGDFVDIGYRYIEVDEFNPNNIKDADMQKIIEVNYEVVKSMQQKFRKGSESLRKELI